MVNIRYNKLHYWCIIGVIIFFIGFSIFFVYSEYKQKKEQFRGMVKLFFFVYIVLVLKATLWRHPLEIRQYQLSLFWSYRAAGVSVHTYYLFVQILLNIILFVPLGLLFSLNCQKPSLIKVLLFVMVLSSSIEAVQYIAKVGICEIDDVFHNTLGGGCGYCLYLVMHSMKRIGELDFSGKMRPYKLIVVSAAEKVNKKEFLAGSLPLVCVILIYMIICTKMIH